MDFQLACLGICAFGLARIFTLTFAEWRMNHIQEIIQTSIKTISLKSFEHLHSLDLYFHRISSRNQVFTINRALRSIESGMRFFLGFFTPMVLEFLMLCGMLQFYCGPLYLGNMLVTLTLYTIFSKEYSKKRQTIIRQRKNQEKKSELYLNESIMNYETVKAFGNEHLEISRYEQLLNKLKKTAFEV